MGADRRGGHGRGDRFGTIGVAGASAGHTTIEATSTCQTTAGRSTTRAASSRRTFVGAVRIRLLDGPASAIAQIPAAGYWDFASQTNPNPVDADHANIGTIDLTLNNFAKTLDTATLTFQANFVDFHIGVPGPPIEHPDTELVRSITTPHNCTFDEGTTTTTKPGEPAAVHAIEPLCISDAPFIDVTFGPETQYTGLTATITFIDVDGNTVGTHQAPYVPNGTVRLVYPGATVDAAGNATDWPGWKLAPNGNWIPDSSDAHLREGLTVRVDVNPTAESQVSYPPETSGCASPPQPPCEEPTTTTSVSTASTSTPPTPPPPTCVTTTQPSSKTLPPTGSNLPGAMTAAAVVTLAVGALAVGTTRRRAHRA